LRDEINKASKNKNLSIDARLGDRDENLTMNTATQLAANCNVDLIVWGTYEKSDSINLTVNYYFANNKEFNKSSEFITLKDVSSIYLGQLTKHLEKDVFLSLSSVIVARDGNKSLAKIWLNKVKDKDKIDHELLQALN